MTKLRCCFCQQELEYCGTYIDGTKKLWCDNCKLFGDNRLFEKLICTRKALDVAVDALNKIANTDIKIIEKEPLYYARAMFSVTNNALNRIRDIEQPEQKDK